MIAEIYAGDTFVTTKGNLDKASRELAAATSLRILPPDHGQELRACGTSLKLENPRGLLCVFPDRLQPLICNYLTEGHTWVKHGIKSAEPERNPPTGRGPRPVGFVEEMVEDL